MMQCPKRIVYERRGGALSGTVPKRHRRAWLVWLRAKSPLSKLLQAEDGWTVLVNKLNNPSAAARDTG